MPHLSLVRSVGESGAWRRLYFIGHDKHIDALLARLCGSCSKRPAPTYSRTCPMGADACSGCANLCLLNLHACEAVLSACRKLCLRSLTVLTAC